MRPWMASSEAAEEGRVEEELNLADEAAEPLYIRAEAATLEPLLPRVLAGSTGEAWVAAPAIFSS